MPHRIEVLTKGNIDEERLNNPLKPNAGEYLVAIRNKRPNPRSNGITDKRKIMIQMLDNDWHETEAGQVFTTPGEAYANWPVGNEAFISTKDPDKAIEMIVESGQLEARVVGQLEASSPKISNKLGVELTAPNNQVIYFPGKD